MKIAISKSLKFRQLMVACYLNISICSLYGNLAVAAENKQNVLAESPVFYCTGDNCPETPPGVINNEYPHAICAKEYRCEGFYVEKLVANQCGCCACNGGSTGCAGGHVVCGDGTLSQMCKCRFRLIE